MNTFHSQDNQSPTIKHEEHISLVTQTGDLAQYLPSRNSDFLGRIDDQVKMCRALPH